MLPVQFITHETPTCTYEESALLALRGGCRWIQLRVKHAGDEEVRPLAERLLKACGEVGAVFVIDDRVELVRSLGADGVHLGKNDMPVDEARRVLGTHYIIGGTANTFDDIQRLARQGADYIGCGPFRFTTTKKNLSPILGLEGYQRIVKQMHDANINLPIVAIGGIKAEDIPAIMQTGVTGIAVSGAVLDAENPVEEMKRFVKSTKPNP